MQKEAESDCTGLEVPSSFTANVWEVCPLTSSPGTWTKFSSSMPGLPTSQPAPYHVTSSIPQGQRW